MFRFLLDPSATEGGGAPPPEAAATTPAAGQHVSLAPDEYLQLLKAKAELKALEEQRKADAERAEAARLKALADKGETDRALSELRAAKETEVRAALAKAESLEATLLGDKLALALRTELGAVQFREGAADLAMSHLAPRFEPVRLPDGSIQVVEKTTRRPAADVIRDALANDKGLAHLIVPGTRGGVGANGARTTPTPAETPVEPARNLGEYVARQWQARHGKK